MSGLVGYGSSSDEDEDLQQTQAARGAGQPPAAAVAEPNEISHLTVPAHYTDEGPMVGPVAQTDIDAPSITDTSDGVDPDLQTMSERDAIRMLTQSTHPMTSIPPSPPGSPDPAANARFRRFLELKAKGIHFNEDLASKSSFRNPKLLSSMMARAGIDESEQYNTSLPKQLWDPTAFPPTAYKEELLKSQQMLREKDETRKKELSASGKRTIEFVPADRAGPGSQDSTPRSSGKLRKP